MKGVQRSVIGHAFPAVIVALFKPTMIKLVILSLIIGSLFLTGCAGDASATSTPIPTPTTVIETGT